MISNDLYNLKVFFNENPKIALGFTGGVKSAYLLHLGKQCGADVRAYYVKTAFQPQSELECVEKLARQFRVELVVLRYNIFQHQSIIENNEERCLLCKEKMLSIIKEQAVADGYTVLIEGSDASEGMGCNGSNSKIALRSPLKELGITKMKVRILSKKAAYLAWDKPSYSCLAAQIPAGNPITEKYLRRIENAERALSMIGFTDFQISIMGDSVRLKVPYSQMEEALEKRKRIIESLKPDFDTVLLDLR